MNPSPPIVLLAIDGSEDAALAARAAVDVCAATGSELHVVHAWRSVPSVHFDAFLRVQFEQEAREVLDAAVERIESGGGVVAGALLRMGSPADEILDLAENLEAGLVVIGSRGRGPIRRLLMGSVSVSVVHGATFPVLVLRGGDEAWPPRRVVIGDDGSEEARIAGDLAVEFGKPFDVKMLLVRAYPELPEVDIEGRKVDARMVDDDMRREEQTLMDRAKEIESVIGIKPRTVIAVGDPAAVLLKAAGEEPPAERTLVAVGSRGHGATSQARQHFDQSAPRGGGSRTDPSASQTLNGTKPLRARTKLLRALAIAALVLVAVLVCARLYGVYRWNSETQDLQARLDAARTPVRPQTVDFRELEGLPTPVQRYFRAALTEGQPMVAGVHVRHEGTFDMGETTEQ